MSELQRPSQGEFKEDAQLEVDTQSATIRSLKDEVLKYLILPWSLRCKPTGFFNFLPGVCFRE